MAPSAVSVPLASIRAPNPVSAPIQVPMSGNRKSANRKNPYIKPAPRAAPNTAPTMPFTRLYSSPASFGFRVAAATGRTAVIGAGAEAIGAGDASGGAGGGA